MKNLKTCSTRSALALCIAACATATASTPDSGPNDVTAGSVQTGTQDVDIVSVVEIILRPDTGDTFDCQLVTGGVNTYVALAWIPIPGAGCRGVKGDFDYEFKSDFDSDMSLVRVDESVALRVIDVSPGDVEAVAVADLACSASQITVRLVAGAEVDEPASNELPCFDPVMYTAGAYGSVAANVVDSMGNPGGYTGTINVPFPPGGLPGFGFGPPSGTDENYGASGGGDKITRASVVYDRNTGVACGLAEVECDGSVITMGTSSCAVSGTGSVDYLLFDVIFDRDSLDFDGDRRLSVGDVAAIQALVGTSIGTNGLLESLDEDADGVLDQSEADFYSDRVNALADAGIDHGIFADADRDQNLDCDDYDLLPPDSALPISFTDPGYNCALDVDLDCDIDADDIAAALAILQPGDLTGDRLVDLADVTAFTTAFNAMDPLADLNNDGIFDLGDITLFGQYEAAKCLP